ncbi:Hint domain-containing protein [Pseudooceanicola nanhaiensis]|uniref:Hint domain-containing protein n=1 Tax=Pseudooceanicola nanhaiensis TaxID=375761 RepID=UPI001CD482AB|nr:Hint domain-containing protein [Pseudooceanicola nanhaiensis]MCA0921837.1 Hint domain-containing protein [Pseudooceanicola nanhaiensis]
MGWLAVSPLDEGLDSPLLRADLPQVLASGSLVLEATFRPGSGGARLFSLKHKRPWTGGLDIRLLPGARVALRLSQERRSWDAEVALPDAEREEMLRLTYLWHAPARMGRLWVERPDRDLPALCVDIAGPPPLPTLALTEEVAGLRGHALGGRTDWAALSDRVEPVGPMPLLTNLVPVEMADGQLRQLDRLKLGDLVRTAQGGVAPVLGLLSHSLPARGRFRPLVLRRPYLGLQRDIVVGAGQRLESAGAAVDYLFGCESVLVEARHMLHGAAALPAPAQALVRYWQVLLPAREALASAGIGLESLAIGRMRMRKAQWSASLLAGMPRGRLPDHGSVAKRVLDRHEAVTLAAQRVA